MMTQYRRRSSRGSWAPRSSVQQVDQTRIGLAGLRLDRDLDARDGQLPRADTADRTEASSEPRRYMSEDVHNDADSKAEEQTEQGASTEHVLATLRVLLTEFLDERLTAG